jgi:hypothetical protein
MISLNNSCLHLGKKGLVDGSNYDLAFDGLVDEQPVRLMILYAS